MPHLETPLQHNGFVQSLSMQPSLIYWNFLPRKLRHLIYFIMDAKECNLIELFCAIYAIIVAKVIKITAVNYSSRKISYVIVPCAGLRGSLF